MYLTTIIDTKTLASHLGDPGFVIVDCRFSLDDEGWGARRTRTRHIPGAAYTHLEHELSGPKTGSNGRHPLPDVEALRRTLGRLGIADGVQVIAYDQDTGSWASRLWWLLRWLGHEAVAVLDGGFAKWAAEGRPTASGVESHPAREFGGAPRADWTLNADQVAAIAGQPGWRLVDARAAERFHGEVEPIDKVPGHIPGAVNHPFKSNLKDDGTFHSPDELRARIHASVGAVAPSQLVAYCGSGVTACHNLLALEIAGLPGAKLYPGSWSEWSSDPSRPIEKP